MDLTFYDIRDEVREGVTFILQRAVIGNKNPRFWILWNRLTKEQQNCLVLSKEPIDGVPTWVCYRLRPKVSGLPYGQFSMSYNLKSNEKLLPYQPRCVAHLCNSLVKNNCAVDGSDTGLGKTYTALAVCRELSLRPGIICKKGGIAGWKKACNYMGITPLFIINWELAKNGKFLYASRSTHEYNIRQYVFDWKVPPLTLLIFDEVHLANHDDSINYSFFTAAKGHPFLARYS